MPTTVQDIMRKTLFTIADSTSIQETAKIMKDKKVSSLLVLDKYEKPVGLVTERDLVRKVCVEDLRTSQVTNKEIMSSPLVTIDSKSSPTDAIDLMLRSSLRHLLVIDNESEDTSRPIGITTPLDLIRYDEYTRDEEHRDVVEMILEYYI
jgi:signal-transduction protein with cAMP-binding, CBS, and nucleotidyltransferase domain